MVYNLNSADILKKDIENKKLSYGYTLCGYSKGDKVSLYLEDEHGKHSKFASQTFYGKLDGNTLNGSFRISNFALIWLIILTVLAIENLVSALIVNGPNGVALSCAIIVVEAIYFFCIRKFSREQNQIIDDYLKSI